MEGEVVAASRRSASAQGASSASGSHPASKAVAPRLWRRGRSPVCMPAPSALITDQPILPCSRLVARGPSWADQTQEKEPEGARETLSSAPSLGPAVGKSKREGLFGKPQPLQVPSCASTQTVFPSSGPKERCSRTEPWSLQSVSTKFISSLLPRASFVLPTLVRTLHFAAMA